MQLPRLHDLGLEHVRVNAISPFTVLIRDPREFFAPTDQKTMLETLSL